MRRYIFAVCAWTLAMCGAAIAQVGSSSLVGQVVDSSEGVVPGVSVVAVQLDTNFRFEAVTNAEGFFLIQGLQPGNYRVTFELPGFNRIVREPVRLSSGETARLNGLCRSVT